MRASMLLLVVLAFCPSWSSAGSGSHPIDAALEGCLGTAEGSTTHGALACIDTAQTAWDRELNRVYGELRKLLGDLSRQKLRDAQRQWIVFRDAEIEAIAARYGELDGTMYLVMQADAVLTLTRDRARQLDASLQARQ